MKVKELIEKLKEFDGELDVFLDTYTPEGLPETSADSVYSFGKKFCSHLNSNLNDQYDEYFHPIIENIEYAGSVFGYKITVNTSVGVTINTDWDGEYHINF